MQNILLFIWDKSVVSRQACVLGFQSLCSKKYLLGQHSLCSFLIPHNLEKGTELVVLLGILTGTYQCVLKTFCFSITQAEHTGNEFKIESNA